jgi:hypothetical protein
MARYAITLLLLLVAAVSGARAQSPGVRFTSEFDPKNFAHAAFLGSGIYSVDGRQLYIIRAPMAFTLRPEEGNLFGLRLSAIPTFGFFDLKFSDVGDFQLPSSLSTFSLLLGVEFQVPVLSNWRLEPFVRAGPAWEFDSNSTTWIFGMGVDSRAEFPTRSTRVLLWNTLLWAGNRESDLSPRDDFGRFDTQLEWLFPIGWKLHKRRTDIGPYVRSEIYFDALLIAPPQGEPLVIHHRYEIGVIWGAQERHHTFWKIPYPRVGLSWRFGDGGSGVRLLLTTRF